MAIKRYVVNNKRKSTCIFVMMLFFIASVFIVLHTRNTNAGVYIKDEDDKYKQIFEINVLEIVALDGQQVLGYTVKGQEPISVEKIEAYTGSANLTSADFKNATGYNVVRDSSGKYKVKSSYLNTSFNDNVLGESMADGEIKVKAVQANALTKEDIDWADLIYINSYDSNPNLLYYYDQIMCDGSMGIVEGDYGPTYNHSMISEGLRKDIATKLISTSAGLNNLKTTITKQMFSYLESEYYDEVNYDRYIEKLESLEVESLYADTIEEAYGNVEGFILDVYNEIKSEAYVTIGEYTLMVDADITDEVKEEVIGAFRAGMYKDYNALNNDIYLEEFRNYSSGITESQVEEIITIANGSATNKSLEQLLVLKTKILEAKNPTIGDETVGDETTGDETVGDDTTDSSEEVDENGLTESDYLTLENCFKTLNFDVKEELVSKYLNEFIKDEFVYDTADATKISGMISEINDTEIENVYTQLFECIGNEEKVEEFANNGEHKLEILELKGYNGYSFQSYIDNLATIEDTDSDGVISKEEVEAYIQEVNEMETTLSEPYDINWFVAEYLYSAIGSKKVALMYNTELLTDKQLGKYNEEIPTVDDSVVTDEPVIDNTNNMYKMLLLLRQVRYDYYKNNLKNSIDRNGVFYDGGYDAENDKYLGNPHNAWNVLTFDGSYGADLANYEKFREPEVIGDTFTATGTKGLNTNYVQDRVYSYTGDQFFGGESFVSVANADNANFKSKNTATATTSIGLDNVLSNPGELTGFSKGDIIRYILEVSLMQLDSPLRVLEIQPAAAVSDFDADLSKGLPNEFTATLKSCHNNKYLYVKDNNIKKQQAVVASSSKKTVWRFKLNSDGSYSIYCNDNTDYVMDVHGNSSTAGTAVEIYSNNGGNNQKWKIVKKGKGYSFISKLSDSLALDQDTNTQYNIQIWNTSDHAAQQFTFEDMNVIEDSSAQGKQKLLKYMGLDPSRTDLIQVTSMSVKEFNTRNEDLISNYDLIYFGINSGYQVVDKDGRTKYNDTDMNGLVYTGIGDEYQIKNFLRGTAAVDYYQGDSYSSGLPKEFTAYIRLCYDTGKYLYAESNGKSNGTKIVGSSSKTKWHFKYNYDGTYSIYRDGTNKVLDVEGASKDNGAKVQLWDQSNGSNQKWNIIKKGSGYSLIPAHATDRSLDFDLGSKYYMQIYSTSDNKAQQFTFQDISVIDSDVTLGGADYDYWYNNFTGAFKGNAIESWNLGALGEGKIWYLKDNSEPVTTRLMGNDITVKKMEMLLDYVKSGYPIMLQEEIYYCDTDKYVDSNTTNDKSQWRYVDVNSKMYNFIHIIKNLGKQDGVYTGLDSDNNKVFDDGYKYANIIIDTDACAKNGRNPENLSDEEKFMGGMSYAIKRSARVDFELLECPKEYNRTVNSLATERTELPDGSIGNVIKTTDSDYRSYKFKLELTSSSKTLDWVKENYGFMILVDKAGTGRFEDKYLIELEPKVQFDFENNTVELTGNWPGNMTGFMPWKVVAYNKSNPNNNFSYLGFSAFEVKDNQKKDVYVLWVKTKSTSTLDFTELLDKYSDEMNDKGLSEYNIKLVTISLSDYRKIWANEQLDTVYTKENSRIKPKYMLAEGAGGTATIGGSTYTGLTAFTDAEKNNENLEFNMIVFGYCDSHGDLDVDSIPAQKNLEYFINSGRSILYAHDNSSFLTTMNYYTNANKDRPEASLYWGRYNTAFLRDTLGMDAYGITYPTEYFKPGHELYDEDIANTRKYLNVTNQQDYRGIIELTVFHYVNDGSGNKLYSSSVGGTSSVSINDWVHTKSVERMNQGQISEYPYVIGDQIDVANTHCQYTALNMEDEELTVWYTLDSRNGNAYYKYTEGDGANNYYIYSKGNVTYTGSGHSGGDEYVNEHKLFFNTVIASIKAGNFQPTVEFPDASILDGKFIAYHQNDDDVKITFRPIDYDADKNASGVFNSTKMYIDVDGVEGYLAGTDILLYDYDTDAISEIYNPADTSKKIENELKGVNLINRNKYSFIFKDSSIDSFDNQIRDKNIVKNTETNEIADIYDCPIVVEVTDADGILAKNMIYLVKIESDLFNLD